MLRYERSALVAQHKRKLSSRAVGPQPPRWRKLYKRRKVLLARKLVALEAAHVRVTLEPPDQVALGHVDLPDITE